MRPLETLPPTETLEIETGLSLVPRVKLNLIIHPFLPSVSKPIDEWQLKRALIDFLKTSLSVSITVPEDDLQIRRLKDLKKRKRDEPVAHGALFIRDLAFLNSKKKSEESSDNEEEDVKELEKKFLDWRKYVAEKMDGIELNLEGVKYNLSVEIPVSDDFERMKKDWEELYAFRNRGYSRGGRQEPDTIVLRGVPSRWFAEPRVSSKPSMLVTHTIFSTFGKIRNLNVAEDNDFGKETDEDDLAIDIVSGLHCKIVVQFEKYWDFYNALKVLCGRSLQKQGSRLSADYEVTWDKDGFFRNSRSQNQEKNSRMQEPAAGRYKIEAPGREPQSQFTSNETRRKRFKE
ncbi:hypothetical protein REPUB_Repub19eG0057600 [Reevesia pubescens]